jgi:hypothetical protein
MSLEYGIGIAGVAVLFAAVGGLLWMADAIRARRAAIVARQIALTDAIHAELGAAAAPDVTRSWARGWTVSVRLPFHRESTVSAITRITHDLFRRLDRRDPPRLRLVLIPREIAPERRVREIDSPRHARLGRAA